MKTMNYEVEEVELTREFCLKAVSKNPEKNRESDMAAVARYADDMKSGNWKNNGEPIVFSIDGKIRQGMHRCKAFLVAGCPRGVYSLVVRLISDVNDDAFKTYDSHNKRKWGQIKKMCGVKNYNAAASWPRVVGQFTHNNISVFSISQLEEIEKYWQPEFETVSSIIPNWMNYPSAFFGAIVICTRVFGEDVSYSACKVLQDAIKVNNLDNNKTTRALYNFIKNHSRNRADDFYTMCRVITSIVDGEELEIIQRLTPRVFERIEDRAASLGICLKCITEIISKSEAIKALDGELKKEVK